MTKTSKTNGNARFTIDFINKAIIGTKTSFAKAGKGISPIYEELAEKMKAHPTFKLKAKEQNKKTRKSKRTYTGMSFNFMEMYISIQKNSERLMSEYESVKAYAKETKFSVYPFTKKWFLGEFDPDNEGFDMKKAVEGITQAGMDYAILNANEKEAAQ